MVPPDGDLDKFAAEISARPPVLLIHGEEDDLIPAQALFQATQGLAALGVPVQWHMSAGVGHGIDEEGLRHGGEFLARHSATPGGVTAWTAQRLGPASQSCHAALLVVLSCIAA